MRHRFRPRYLVVFSVDLALVLFARFTSFSLFKFVSWITVCRDVLNAIRTHTCIDHKQEITPFYDVDGYSRCLCCLWLRMAAVWLRLRTSAQNREFWATRLRRYLSLVQNCRRQQVQRQISLVELPKPRTGLRYLVKYLWSRNFRISQLPPVYGSSLIVSLIRVRNRFHGLNTSRN
jgi:hypothetical protein